MHETTTLTRAAVTRARDAWDTTPRRVLIVDDSEDLRLVVRFAMSGDGRLEVVGEAVDGAEAVALAARLQPDVVLLDLSMPRVDGREALRGLGEVAPDAVVVVYTAQTSRGREADLRARGADAVISKSVPLRVLCDRLATHPRGA